MESLLVRDRGTLVQRLVGEFRRFPLLPQMVGLGYVGSISHGTHLPDVIDDTDLMGIVVPPEPYVLGLRKWEHYTLQKDELDVVLYSARKMFALLLKQNPNVLGFLWLKPEHYVVRTKWLDTLIENREVFSSKRAYHSFVGYATSQLKKMHKGAYRGYMGAKRKALVDKFGFDPKNAAHLIRLLRMGTEYLETGQLNVYREHDGEELLAIKQGEWPFRKIEREAESLFARAKEAYETTDLPDNPDFEAAEGLLMAIHRDYLEI